MQRVFLCSTGNAAVFNPACAQKAAPFNLCMASNCWTCFPQHFFLPLTFIKPQLRKISQSLYPNCGFNRIVIWIGESFALVIRMAKNPHDIQYIFVFLDSPSPCLKEALKRYLESSSDMQLVGRVS